MWQRLTPESKFEPGGLYVVLVPGHAPFVAEWDEESGLLIDIPKGYGQWAKIEGSEARDFPQLRFYHPLEPIPEDIQAECQRAHEEWYDRTYPPANER